MYTFLLGIPLPKISGDRDGLLEESSELPPLASRRRGKPSLYRGTKGRPEALASDLRSDASGRRPRRLTRPVAYSLPSLFPKYVLLPIVGQSKPYLSSNWRIVQTTYLSRVGSTQAYGPVILCVTTKGAANLSLIYIAHH